MTLFQWLIIGAILMLVLVSAMHSVMGEKLLLKPMFKQRGNRVLENALARRVIRFAWHATSLMWVMMAAILYVVGFSPDSVIQTVLIVFAIGFLISGVLDCIVTRGRHMGWSVLASIGGFCLAAFSVMGSPS